MTLITFVSSSSRVSSCSAKGGEEEGMGKGGGRDGEGMGKRRKGWGREEERRRHTL